MKVNVSVNTAIRKGRLMVNLPGALIFLTFLVALPSVMLQYTNENWIIITAIVIGFAVGFAFGWLYSGFAVIRWKIWAYENVRNLHELKEKAILEKVIYPDGHWTEKYNFANYEQRQKLKQLERKFTTTDEYHDDLAVAKETAIHISKKSILIPLGVGAFCIGLAMYRYYTQRDSGSNFIPLALLGLLFTAWGLRDALKKEPQIRINTDGIQLYKKELMPWEFITNEHIEVLRNHKKHDYYLLFDYNGQQEKKLINNLATNQDQLEHLLQVYRLRYNKKQS